MHGFHQGTEIAVAGRFATDPLGTISPVAGNSIQDYVQPDTQIEPSIAVNPANPLNAVTVYQEGRIAGGGDATNGFATTFDGGATWIHGELPGLTTYPGQGGAFERASDAVVAFGPGNLVYANSLVFDFNTGGGLRSGIAVNVSKDGGRTWSQPVILQDDRLGGITRAASTSSGTAWRRSSTTTATTTATSCPTGCPICRRSTRSSSRARA